MRALSRMTAEEMAIYPEYQATTKRLARFFGVRPAEMHLTNGIDDALHLIADTFIEDGDSVLVVEPTFDMLLRVIRPRGWQTRLEAGAP